MALAIAASLANIRLMNKLFYLGWLLLIVAFAAASAEAVASRPGTFLSAHELWYAISAKHFTITQIRIERISPALWDPVLLGILTLPAWLLFGLPGVLLAWYCRPGRVLSPEEEEDHRKHEESLFLLDELAKEAKRNGYIDNDDDMAPDHSGHDTMDAMHDFPVPSDAEIQREIESELSDNPTQDVPLETKGGIFKDKPE